MTKYDYDLFVIGAGSGGVRAARLAAQLGKKVAVAEEDRPGGTCVLRGCVPKKFMVYASEVTEQIAEARGLGWDAHSGTFDWNSFRDRSQAELTRLSQIYSANLVKAGVEIVNAHAAFADAHTLILTTKAGGQRRVTAETILIATGGWPFLPQHCPGVAEHGLTSNDMFLLPELPKSLVIVGGGYIAVEFAGIMHGLGVDVTLLYRGQKILRGFDDDVRDHLANEMALRGVKIRTQLDPVALRLDDGGRTILSLNDGSEMTADKVLYASGRKPKTEGLNLEAIGITPDAHGAIPVDPFSRTELAHIYAIGDVTNRMNLTPVAIREGVAFVETVYKDNPTAFDHENIPTAVFSQPQIGTVGLTEAEAVEKAIAFDVYTARFKPMKTAFIGGDSRIFMKLIVEQKSDVVLGVHMVGGDAGEIIQLAGVAVKARLTKAQWDATCAVHPTAAEELVTLKDKRA
ncbi:glutathione-disulfide reductase [Asticcacaulis sp. EMRT-3]|uniref:glutathione-disulfide reductase n=1 Tax=Asticcacaulis sp. EMRT-3 TaxID=3040349 RepID=UPI0024AFF86E|nr:glutathione-disulfide reductase [Asticcacaulis sp. EMRT-3]MDI7774333.1 glutathione-disulfide reductase [Asticcacaulis sp. EMRT-3]